MGLEWFNFWLIGMDKLAQYPQIIKETIESAALQRQAYHPLHSPAFQFTLEMTESKTPNN